MDFFEKKAKELRPSVQHWISHGTIYSATTFLESCRKVVGEKWLEKSGSRNLVREKWLTRKKGGFILRINIFSGWRKVVDQKKKTILKNHFSRTTFLEKWLQNKWSSARAT